LRKLLLVTSLIGASSVRIGGLTNEFKGAAFVVATGLLIYPQMAHAEGAHAEHFGPKLDVMAGTGGYSAQVATWLR
jgi:cell division protein FtsA